MYRVGIDIGGTGIKFGVLDDNLNILAEKSIPTCTSDSFENQIGRIAEGVSATAFAAGIDVTSIHSIGIGIPGIANRRTGEIILCTNMGWSHVPFADEFRKHIDVPVLIENDANVAALAESIVGVSKGASSSVFITVGTGIGSGIIIGGKIWTGFHGIGGELGHVIFDLDGVSCSCGNRGCLERYCSATALIRMAHEALSKESDSLMLKIVAGDVSKIEARTVIDAAKQEDPTALQVYSRYIDCLSQAVASIVNFLDPEVIVIGGGVSKAGSFLIDPIKHEFVKYVLYKDQPMPEIRLAECGPEAGIIGAAMLS